MSVPDSVVQLRTARRWYLQARRQRYDELWEALINLRTREPDDSDVIHRIIIDQIEREEKEEESSDG